MLVAYAHDYGEVGPGVCKALCQRVNKTKSAAIAIGDDDGRRLDLVYGRRSFCPASFDDRISTRVRESLDHAIDRLLSDDDNRTLKEHDRTH